MSFILTIDREDDEMVNPFKFGNHNDIIEIDLPRINTMKDQVKIVCFTFEDKSLNTQALSKEEQVVITNYIRNTRNEPKVAAIAHAIYDEDVDAIQKAFRNVIEITK